MNDTDAKIPDKTVTGNYFDDFKLGQEIVHATPRTLTVGDTSLFTALYGSRFAVQSSDAFAHEIGYPRSPIDDLLVFHIVIGKTVPVLNNYFKVSTLRAPNAMQTCFATEQVVDQLAYLAGIDPYQFRLNNISTAARDAANAIATKSCFDDRQLAAERRESAAARHAVATQLWQALHRFVR